MDPMVGRKVSAVAILACGLVIASGCGRETSVSPTESGAASPSQDGELPFERAAQKTGISPTSSVIPPGANLPVGTAITVRLKSAISSASERTGDRFLGLLEEPIVVNGETIAPVGGVVIGRVLESRRAARSNSPGYLRLVLTSIPILGKSTLVQTSSSFIKGSQTKSVTVAQAGHSGDGLLAAAEAASGNGPVLGATTANRRMIGGVIAKDAFVGSEHHLTFRLTEPLLLPEQDQ
jgi:hypothetical protein